MWVQYQRNPLIYSFGITLAPVGCPKKLSELKKLKVSFFSTKIVFKLNLFIPVFLYLILSYFYTYYYINLSITFLIYIIFNRKDLKKIVNLVLSIIKCLEFKYYKFIKYYDYNFLIYASLHFYEISFFQSFLNKSHSVSMLNLPQKKTEYQARF